MMRMPMRCQPGYKRLSNKDSAAAEECLDYIEDVHLREHNIYLYRQYRITLTVLEKKWLANKFAEHHIPVAPIFSNICVNGYYYVLQEEGENDDEMVLDKCVRHIVEFDGCYWHACEICGAGQQHYGIKRSNRLFITREKHQMAYKL